MLLATRLKGQNALKWRLHSFEGWCLWRGVLLVGKAAARLESLGWLASGKSALVVLLLAGWISTGF